MMPSIKGRVNDFLQRQLTFVHGNTSNGNNNETRNVQVRRSQSFKENESVYKKNSSGNQTNSTTTTTTSTTKIKDKKEIKMGTFITNYLNGQLNKHHPDIISGKTCYDLPVKRINKLSPKITAAFTGPNDGLTRVKNKNQEKPFEIECDIDFIDDDCNNNTSSSGNNNVTQPKQTHQPRGSTSSFSSTTSTTSTCSQSSDNSINDNLKDKELDDKFFKANTLPLGQECAGIADWNRPSDYSFGIATNLYECHPKTAAKAGEPVADAFAINVRENSAILCLADGVNWGEKACIAARSAIHGSMDYLNKAIYHESGQIQNTLDIFVALLRSFSAAHNLILEENGLLTTLTVAIVAQLENSDRFIVCTCNVGDSLAYIYSKEYGVREVTQGSHDIFSMRDMRDALGALGPVDGQNPELNNLTVAMTICDIGDIVFLTSDGVSDNFDPVVGKFALPKKKDKPINLTNTNEDKSTIGHLSEKQSNINKSKEIKSPIKTKISRRIEHLTTTSKHSRSKVHRSNSNPDKSLKEHHQHNHHHNNNSLLKSHHNNNNNHIINKNNHKVSNSKSNSNHQSFIPLPIVTAEQRHALALLRMEDLLFNGVNATDKPCTTAKKLCEIMIEFVQKLTMAKRHILEDPELYNLEDELFDQTEQKDRRRKVYDKLAMVPGKLDHATIVAYQVGFYGEMANKVFEKKNLKNGQENNHNLRLKATLAKIDD